jgi:hypothetical protein
MTTEVRLSWCIPSPDERGRACVSLVFLALLAVLFTYPAWSLPLILVDEPSFIDQGRVIGEHLRAGRVMEGLRATIPASRIDDSSIMNFGPAVYGTNALGYALIGPRAAAWHIGKTLQLVLTLWGLFAIARAGRIPALPATLGCALCVMLSPGLYALGFHAHQGNWVRMFNTDTFQLSYGVLQLAAFFWILRRPKFSWALLAGYGIVSILCFFSKLTALVLAIPQGLILVLYCLWLRRIPKRAIAVFLVLTTTWLLALWLYNPFAAPPPGAAPEGIVSRVLSWTNLRTGIFGFGPMILDATGGVLLPLAVASFCLLLSPRVDVWTRFVLLALLVTALITTLLQCTWRIILPRYLVTFLPFQICFAVWGSAWLLLPSGRWMNGWERWVWLSLSFALGTLLWFWVLQPLWSYEVSGWANRVVRLKWLAVATALLLIDAGALWVASRWLRFGRAVDFLAPICYALVMVLQGFLGLHMIHGWVAQQDFLRHYSGWARADGNATRFMAAWSPREMASGQSPSFMLFPPNGEEKWQMAIQARLRHGLADARPADWDEKRLDAMDYVMIRRENTNDTFTSYKSLPLHRGYRVERLDLESKESGYTGARADMTWGFLFRPSQELALAGLEFYADTIRWEPDVDLRVILDDGFSRHEEVITSEAVLRSRLMTHLWFRNIVRLSPTRETRLEFRFERKDGLPPSRRQDAGIFRHIRGSALLDGKATNAQPWIRLLTAKELPAGLELVRVEREIADSFTFMSPYSLYKHSTINRDLAMRDAWRAVQYHFEVEIYRHRGRMRR